MSERKLSTLCQAVEQALVNQRLILKVLTDPQRLPANLVEQMLDADKDSFVAIANLQHARK